MVGTFTHRGADFFPDRINMYVKAMRYAADLHDDGTYKLGLGTPDVLDLNGIVAAFTVTGGVTIAVADMVGAVAFESDAKFGRAVQIDFSAAGTPVVNINGFDYLGQAMTENITGNGTTPVLGKKAFMRVTEIIVASGVTGTIDVGTTDVLGLPYKSHGITKEIADGSNQSAGTFVQGVLTDPQTATTGDPRGTYNPTVVMDGVIDIVVLATADNWVNAAGNGGYYGIKQFAA